MRAAFAVCCVAAVVAGRGYAAELPTLPGADLLGIGYDAVYGMPRNLPVVDLSSYSEGRTWENPFIGVTYRVPDQAFVHTGTDHTATTKVYHSSKSYAEDRTLDVDVGVHAGPWLTLSTDVQTAHSVLSGGDTVLSETRQRIVVFDAAVLPASLAGIADKFDETVAHLPAAYDAAEYASFLSYYGTHVVVGGSFGGEARLRALATSAYFSEHNDVDIGVQASIKWQQYSLGANVSHTSSSSRAWTKSGSTVDASAVGGDPSIDWTREFGDWARSVYTVPAEVRLSLFPLHKFVRNATVAANVARAVAEYHAAHPLPSSPATPTTTSAKLPFCMPAPVVHSGGPNGHLFSCNNPGATTRSVPVTTIDLHSGYQVMGGTGSCCGPAFTIDNVNSS